MYNNTSSTSNKFYNKATVKGFAEKIIIEQVLNFLQTTNHIWLILLAAMLSGTDYVIAQLPATGGSGPFGAPSTVSLNYSGPCTNSVNAYNGSYVTTQPSAPNAFIDLGSSANGTAGSGGLNYIFINSGSWGNCQFFGLDKALINQTNNNSPALGISGYTGANQYNIAQSVRYVNGALNVSSPTPSINLASQSISGNTLTYTGTCIVPYYGGTQAPTTNNPTSCDAYGIKYALVDMRVTLKAWTTAGAAINWINDATDNAVVIRVPNTNFYVNVLYEIDNFDMGCADATTNTQQFSLGTMANPTTAVAPGNGDFKPASWLMKSRHGTNTGTPPWTQTLNMAFNPKFFGPKIPAIPSITPATPGAGCSPYAVAFNSNVNDAIIGVPGGNVINWLYTNTSGSPGVVFSPTTGLTTTSTITNNTTTPTATNISYSVDAGGGCIVGTSTTVPVTVNPNAIITLTSGITNPCINAAFTPVTYSITGGGTGASITGGSLPPGILGSFSGGVYTISGTPTTSGTYNYTVGTSGNCTQTSANGTITVIPNATISLSSAPGTNAQTICPNGSIANITYAVGGGATSAGATGLPGGVTGSFSAGVFTISGTPTTPGTYNYTVTTTGNCIQTSAGGSITVSPLPTVPNAFTTTWLADHFVNTNFVTTPNGGSNISYYRLGRSVDNNSAFNTFVNGGATYTAGTPVTVSGADLPTTNTYRYYMWYGYDACGNQSVVGTATYVRMDATAPTRDAVTVNNLTWVCNNANLYTITCTSTETGYPTSGIGWGGPYGVMALINYQGPNSGPPFYGGYFSWNPTAYTFGGDQIPSTGNIAGFASKDNSGTYGDGRITLVSCTANVTGNVVTVVFTVRPNANFTTACINHISMFCSDRLGNQSSAWQEFSPNFSSTSANIITPLPVSAATAGVTGYSPSGYITTGKLNCWYNGGANPPNGNGTGNTGLPDMEDMGMSNTSSGQLGIPGHPGFNYSGLTYSYTTSSTPTACGGYYYVIDVSTIGTATPSIGASGYNVGGANPYYSTASCPSLPTYNSGVGTTTLVFTGTTYVAFLNASSAFTSYLVNLRFKITATGAGNWFVSGTKYYLKIPPTTGFSVNVWVETDGGVGWTNGMMVPNTEFASCPYAICNPLGVLATGNWVGLNYMFHSQHSGNNNYGWQSTWGRIYNAFNPTFEVVLPPVVTSTNPTCVVNTGSVNLSNLPPTGSWVVNSDIGGYSTSGTNVSTGSISGIAAPGTYAFTTTTASLSSCPSSPSTTIGPTLPLGNTTTWTGAGSTGNDNWNDHNNWSDCVPNINRHAIMAADPQPVNGANINSAGINAKCKTLTIPGNSATSLTISNNCATCLEVGNP